MNNKMTFGVLTLTAIVMAICIFQFSPKQADAGFTIQKRDYTLVTAQATGVGDVLYVQRGDLVAAFIYNTRERQIELKDLRKVSEAFE